MKLITEHGEWDTDYTTGRLILVLDGCSVIEDKAAEFVLGLIESHNLSKYISTSAEYSTKIISVFAPTEEELIEQEWIQYEREENNG